MAQQRLDGGIFDVSIPLRSEFSQSTRKGPLAECCMGREE